MPCLKPVSHTDGVGRDYKLKCHLINRCFQEEIRFGHYQWQLFIITGLEWLADNLWLYGLSIVLAQVQQELRPSSIRRIDRWRHDMGNYGRPYRKKTVFQQITLFLTGLFGLVAGGVPNFVTFCSLAACMGFGVGGNLPVDGMRYLEQEKFARFIVMLLKAPCICNIFHSRTGGL